MARFLIVVPTFQADGWLDQCLNSICSQGGRHEVHLHLQDGGSTDATLEIARRWRSLCNAATSPFAGRVTMSLDSGPDGGLYDAVMRGFAALEPEPGDLMTWLNADDLLAPGALASIASCLAEIPTISLCGGRVSMIDALGRVVRVNAPVALSRKLLAAGLYDGRRMPFVMQEGTFWRQELWCQVGGLDPTFRLAGDWDLWRRMARYVDYVTLDVLTAFHRRRPGQLSENLDAYYGELDRRLTGAVRSAYDEVHADYIAAGAASGGQAFAGFEGPVAQLDRDTLKWSLIDRFGERLAPEVVQSVDGRTETRRGGILAGATGFEGPYPEWDLPAGIRWITERHARLSIPTQGPGRHAVKLLCRAGVADLSVTVRAGDEVLLSVVLNVEAPLRDQALTFDLWSAGGDVELELETWTPHGDPERRLLVVDLLSTPRPAPEIPPRAPAGEDRITIIARSRPQGLARTLESVANQGVGALGVRVVAEASDPVVAAVLDAFRPLIDEIAVDAGVPAVTGRQAVIEAGMRLIAGALERGFSTLPGSLTGASRQVDARGVSWRVPAGLGGVGGPSFQQGGQTGAAVATDALLATEPPSEADSERPRLLRLIRSDQERRDDLSELIARMNAEVRLHPVSSAGRVKFPEVLEAWRPDLVIAPLDVLERLDGPTADLCPQLVAGADLINQAGAALARIDWRRHPRSLARAILGIGPQETVWLVETTDLGRIRRRRDSDGVRLVVVGTDPSGPALKAGALAVGPAEAAELRSWLLSAADAVVTSRDSSPAWRDAITAGGLSEVALDAATAEGESAPVDVFARSVLGALGDAPAVVRRALRFRSIAAVRATRLWAGAGAKVVDGGLEIDRSGLVFLAAEDDGPVRLRLNVSTSAVAEIRIEEDGNSRSMAAAPESVLTVQGRRDRPIAVRFEAPARTRLRIALADAPTPATATPDGAIVWDARAGFGPEEPAAPDFGLNAPFRWIEQRRACLTFLNPKADRVRLTLWLRSLMVSQRVMIRIGDEIIHETDIAGGDIRTIVPITLQASLGEGMVEVELIFSSWATTPDRNLAAIVETVTLAPAPKASPVPETVWRDLDGFDFEEPAAPQFGLTTAFRWRLPGSRIAVSGQAPGRHHVIVRYRSALPGQVLTAFHRGVELGQNTATSGRLDTDEVLAFEVDYDDRPIEIALAADRYMEGERPLGFIIQSVSVEPTL